MIWGVIIEKALDVGTELLFGDDDLDMDDDGDVDNDDVELIIQRCEMSASVMGLVAQVDGEVAEEEEDQAWEFLNNTCLKTLTKDLLKQANISKKEIKKRLMKKFTEPYSFKQIARYAEANDMEENFYELACIMVMADGVVDDEEKEFLDDFAKKMDLIRYDKKRIERKYLKS